MGHSISSITRKKELFKKLSKMIRDDNDESILQRIIKCILSHNATKFSLYLETMNLYEKYFILKNEIIIFDLLHQNKWQKGVLLFQLFLQQHCQKLQISPAYSTNTVINPTRRMTTQSDIYGLYVHYTDLGVIPIQSHNEIQQQQHQKHQKRQSLTRKKSHGHSHSHKSSIVRMGQPYSNNKGSIEYNPNYSIEDAIRDAKRMHRALFGSGVAAVESKTRTKTYDKDEILIDCDTIINIAGTTTVSQRLLIRRQYNKLYQERKMSNYNDNYKTHEQERARTASLTKKDDNDHDGDENK